MAISPRDPPIHVLDGANSLRGAELSLRGFIDPEPTVHNTVSQLTLADGKVTKVHVGRHLRSFPSFLRYDTRGLELFEELTRLEDEYYLAAAEQTILKAHLEALAEYVADGAAIVELGCGSMTKTAVILDHLRRVARKRDLEFYALDIDEAYLRSALAKLKEEEDLKRRPAEHGVRYAGILGTYDQAVEFLPNIKGPRVLLWLGTSMGNMTRSEASEFLHRYQSVMAPEDVFVVGIDSRKDPKTTVRAYNDTKGVAAKLGMNTLTRLNQIFAAEVFNLEEFERWVGYNNEAGQIEAYIKSRRAQTVVIPGRDGEVVRVRLRKGELISYMISVKYSTADLHSLAASAEMTLREVWTDPREVYYVCLFQKTAVEE